MRRYLVRRLSLTVLLVCVVATVLFFFIHLVPGDPAEVILGSSEVFHPSKDQIEAVRRTLGLDRPLLQQYLTYLMGVLRGELGVSFLTGRPVALDLWLRFGRTLQLVVPAVILSSLLGIFMGVLAAQHHGRLSDVLLSAAGLFGHSLPAFVVGNLLVLALAIRLGWLPSSGFVEFTQDPGRSLAYMVLPVMALALGRIGSTMRMARAAIVEHLTMDYVRTARAKGLPERIVLYRHVLKNALIPVVTVVGLQLGGMFAGAIVVESIFNWPGLNMLLLRAVANRDYPLIQGTVLVSSVVFISVNFFTDLSYALLDPRIRYE